MCTCGCVLNIHSSIWKLHTANTFSEDTICRRTHFQWRHIEDRLRTRFVEGHIEDTSVARTDCAAAVAARPEAESGGGGHVTCAQFVHICAFVPHFCTRKCWNVILCIVHTLRGHVDLFAHCTCLFNPGLDHSHWAEHTCEDPTPIQRGNHSVRFVHIHSRSAVFGTSAIPGYSRREAITCLVESTLRGLLYSYIHP